MSPGLGAVPGRGATLGPSSQQLTGHAGSKQDICFPDAGTVVCFQKEERPILFTAVESQLFSCHRGWWDQAPEWRGWKTHQSLGKPSWALGIVACPQKSSEGQLWDVPIVCCVGPSPGLGFRGQDRHFLLSLCSVFHLTHSKEVREEEKEEPNCQCRRNQHGEVQWSGRGPVFGGRRLALLSLAMSQLA